MTIYNAKATNRAVRETTARIHPGAGESDILSELRMTQHQFIRMGWYDDVNWETVQRLLLMYNGYFDLPLARNNEVLW